MLKGLFDVFLAFFSWLKYPIIIFIALVCFFYFLIALNIIISLLKGKRFKKA